MGNSNSRAYRLYVRDIIMHVPCALPQNPTKIQSLPTQWTMILLLVRFLGSHVETTILQGSDGASILSRLVSGEVHVLLSKYSL